MNSRLPSSGVAAAHAEKADRDIHPMVIHYSRRNFDSKCHTIRRMDSLRTRESMVKMAVEGTLLRLCKTAGFLVNARRPEHSSRRFTYLCVTQQLVARCSREIQILARREESARSGQPSRLGPQAGGLIPKLSESRPPTRFW